MFTGYIKYFFSFYSLQRLVECVKFIRLGEMRKISRVEYKRRTGWHCVYFGNRSLQGSDHIRVCWFIKTNMAVADLYKTEIRSRQHQAFFQTTGRFIYQLAH